MDSLCQRITYNNLSDAYDILVPACHECIDFAEGGDWETMFLFVQLQLLERDDVPSLFISGSENDAIGPLFDRVESLVAIN